VADPQTTNLGLYIPTRGSDVGTWDLPENANDSATDSLFANVATISLTNANVTLTTPPNSGASWSGPYQSQSAILKFTGTLTGNCVITLPRPGFFVVDNQCTVGSFYVRLGSSSPGKYITAPPGYATHVYCDGTDVKYINLAPVASEFFLIGATQLPAWMTACSTLPYLIQDGSVYNYSDYPALGNMLGSTFGGNGITTFAVPDARNRTRVSVDTNPGSGPTLRLTAGSAGFNGQSIAAAGGDQNLVSHAHSITDMQHSHSATTTAGVVQLILTGYGSFSGGGNQAGSVTVNPSFTGITGTNAAGAGGSQNVQPTIVSGLALIKT